MSEQDFAINKQDRCPVVLVLDTSFSMTSDRRIDALNDGVETLREELIKDPVASSRVEISVITFGSSAQVRIPFQTAYDFQSERYNAEGATPMGAAMELALQEVEARKAEYRAQGIGFYRPWIWLMTDGAPTDDYKSAAQAAVDAEAAKKAMIFAVGVGDDADLSVLGEFSQNRPPLMLKGLEFREMFVWLSSSLQKVSSGEASAGNDEAVDLPPIDGWGQAFS